MAEGEGKEDCSGCSWCSGGGAGLMPDQPGPGGGALAGRGSMAGETLAPPRVEDRACCRRAKGERLEEEVGGEALVCCGRENPGSSAPLPALNCNLPGCRRGKGGVARLGRS